tara:strand:- start:228 stop:476 length:249 start_codon:yes stop_codon:yes gene_type:complete
MSINKIQFQKGLSIIEFIDNYGTDEQCLSALFNMRRPTVLHAPAVAAQNPARSLPEYNLNAINIVNKTRSLQAPFLAALNSL